MVPNHSLTSDLSPSAGEKEKRLLESDNEQSNLKNCEVPTKKAANTHYRHKVNRYQGLIRLLFKRATLWAQIRPSFHETTGSTLASHPPWKKPISINCINPRRNNESPVPALLIVTARTLAEQAAACSPACEGLTAHGGASGARSRHGNTQVTTIFSIAFWLLFFNISTLPALISATCFPAR